MGTKFKSLACHLGALPDPRKVKRRRHVLLDILVIAVLAALCGIDDWESTVDFAKGQDPTSLRNPRRRAMGGRDFGG